MEGQMSDLIVVGFHGKHWASEALAGHDRQDRRASGIDLSDIGPTDP
jgi:hypothetical protein